MIKFILKLYDLFSKNRKRVLLISALMLLLMGLISYQLDFQEDISGFLPQTEENKRVNFIYQNSASSEKIIVRFKSDGGNNNSDNINTLIKAADSFAEKLEKLNSDSVVSSIQTSISSLNIDGIIPFIYNNIPYFLSDDEFARMDSIVSSNDYSSIIKRNKELLLSPLGLGTTAYIQADPLHLSAPILQRLTEMNSFGDYILIEDYIFSKDTSSLYVFIEPAYPTGDTYHNAILASHLDNVVSEVVDNVSVDYFGAGLVGVTNANRIKKDSLWAMLVSVLLIGVVMSIYFRNPLLIISLFFPVLFGILFALSSLSLLKGSLSLIALGAGSVIIGIAINYSLHYLIHFRLVKNARIALKEIAFPMLIGNLTTVGAFISLLFVSSDSMHDFGLFAALSLIGTMLCVILVYPHLFHNQTKYTVATSLYSDQYKFSFLKLNKLTGWILIFITLFLGFNAQKVDFDSDLQNINYMTSEQRSVFNEFKSNGDIGAQSTLIIAEGQNFEEALNTYESQRIILNNYTENNKIKGIGNFLPSDSIQRIRLSKWNNYWQRKADSVITIFQQNAVKEGFHPDAFTPFYATLSIEVKPQPISYFAPIKESILNNFIIKRDSLVMIMSIVPTELVSDKMAGELAQLPTSYSISTTSIAQRLVADLSDDFNYVLLSCSILVFLFLWMAFRRIELTILSFIPMVISWIWILGIMYLVGLKFNIVNIILATFIFGMGDDYVIFVVDGLVSEYKSGKKLLGHYKTSILLSALTMFIGIGTLSFAQHPAMQSLGLVAIIGMIVVTAGAFLIPPVLFSYLTMNKGKKRLMPITLYNWIVTAYSFVVFIIGSIFLTIAGILRITILGASPSNKYKYHLLLHRISTWVVRNMVNVKYTKKGSDEVFDKPGIVICNHQSHLDLMFVLSLSPKLIVLTNKWVWRFPIYGQIIRYADFYPIHDNGIESSVEYLRPLIEQGYSIVVFPEGTRSPDCKIQRFHRGAFYLAEQLNLDIIPVLFHGIGHIFPKKEFLFRKGEVTTFVLPRIPLSDPSYGPNYLIRAKTIKKLFAHTYKKLSQEIETPQYFADLVLKNYIYKGGEIERKARLELKRIDRLTALIEQIPPCEHLLIKNCSIGVSSLLIALSQKELKITATDNDIESLDIAAHCSSVPNNLNYISQVLDEKIFLIIIDANTLTIAKNEV